MQLILAVGGTIAPTVLNWPAWVLEFHQDVAFPQLFEGVTSGFMFPVVPGHNGQLAEFVLC
jgi:hypothetical protein